MKEQKQKRRTRLAALLLALAVGVGVAIPTGVFAQTPTPADAQPEVSQPDNQQPETSQPGTSEEETQQPNDQPLRMQPKAGNDNGTSVTIPAKKILLDSNETPAALKADQFTFALMEGGADVATETNDAEGDIRFNLPIGEGDFSSGSESATKTYTMVERRGVESNITYDRSQYTVTVQATRHAEYKGWWIFGYWEYSNYRASITSSTPTFTNKIGAGVTPEPFGDPEHNKQAILNEDGTYTLSLDVTGKSETQTMPVDVILVADESSSMNTSNRMRNLKTAAKIFSSSLLTDANAQQDASAQTRVALIGFYDIAQTVCGFTADKATLDKGIDDLEVQRSGNTNWEKGLTAAQQLSSGRENTKKYIVFLTDGNPAASGEDFTTSWYNAGVAAGKQIVGGGTTLISVGVDVGNMYWVNATKDNIARDDYSSSSRRPSPDHYRSLEAFSIRVGSQYHNAASADLSKVFEDIAETINRTYKNVSITDTLSDYVEFADSGNVQVTVAASDGSQLVAETDYKTVINKDTKTVRLNLLKPLANNVTYTISYTVKPSQLAYDTYAMSGTPQGSALNYPHTGDPNTGTYAGQTGFYANEGAWVDYTDADGSVQKTDYAKPVVQVQLQTIPVKKEWQGASPAGTTVTANLYMDGNTETPVQLVSLTDGADTPNDPSDDWKGAFENLAPGHSYTVSETPVSGYTSKVDPSEGISLTADNPYDGFGFTITNTPSTKTIYIQKLGPDGDDEGTDPDPLDGAQFKLYKQDDTEAAVQPAKVPGSVGNFTLANLPLGTYWLEETQAPDGHQLLANRIQFTVSADGVELAAGTSDQISLNPAKDTINIMDEQKPELPLTGGSGTVWFLIVGSVLVGGALALLIWRYIIRKNKKAD